jgi:hypothetical protein
MNYHESNHTAPSHARSIAEAQTLVKRCAEPRPVGDQVKAAIHRASRRLKLPFNRARDMWYGDAKRIDSEEMDRLRTAAEQIELTQAIVCIASLRNRMLASPSRASHTVIAGLDGALRVLSDRNQGGWSDDVSKLSAGPHVSLVECMASVNQKHVA